MRLLGPSTEKRGACMRVFRVQGTGNAEQVLGSRRLVNSGICIQHRLPQGAVFVLLEEARVSSNWLTIKSC